MTATLDKDLIFDLDLDQPCECDLNHHPEHQPCDRVAEYAVVFGHATECWGTGVFLLCQECLDEAQRRVEDLIGVICATCGKRVSHVTDMIGPILPLHP
jgi:DNA primase catalytic subunit